jgi:hypothetical protein
MCAMGWELQESHDDISDVSQQGGGIDRRKFIEIINPENITK